MIKQKVAKLLDEALKLLGNADTQTTASTNHTDSHVTVAGDYTILDWFFIPDYFSYRIAKHTPVHTTAGLPRIAPPPLSFLG